MSVLLIAEHNNKELRPFTLNAVTAASQIDQDVHAVIIGHNSEEAVKALSALPAVKKVISVEAPHYENFTAENFAPIIVKLAENYTHIVSSKTMNATSISYLKLEKLGGTYCQTHYTIMTEVDGSQYLQRRWSARLGESAKLGAGPIKKLSSRTTYTGWNDNLSQLYC